MKPSCKLVGTDGNAVALIAKVRDTLRRENLKKEVDEFKDKAFACKSYDELLRLIMDYVEIE
jgi:hypothetical protein